MENNEQQQVDQPTPRFSEIHESVSPPKKHSGLGIASFIIAIISFVLGITSAVLIVQGIAELPVEVLENINNLTEDEQLKLAEEATGFLGGVLLAMVTAFLFLI